MIGFVVLEGCNMNGREADLLPIKKTGVDALIGMLDDGLRTVFAPAKSNRKFDVGASQGAEKGSSSKKDAPLTDSEKKFSAQLMRVNHVGEICAQALYTGQAAGTRNFALKQHLQHAAEEEVDHLAWTEQRLQQLRSHKSFLNPLWYTGAFVLGYTAAKAGDDWSLGFVEETEKQVEAHLNSHLEKLPANDHISKAIVRTMREDEAEHARQAQALGARKLPVFVRFGMRACAKVMTTVAARI